MEKTSWTERARRTSAHLTDVGRELTSGVDRRGLERLFDEDAVRAFTVLAGEKPTAPSHAAGAGESLRLFLSQAKAFFLGLALKLSPARRVLFVAGLLSPLLGLFAGVEIQAGRRAISVDFSPLFFFLGIGALTLLLALELTDRLRVRDELDVARELQRALLPSRAPRPLGFEFAHSYRTANEIGGDYYDFLSLEDGRLALAVGDASGHGIGAGLLMAISHALLKSALDIDPRPPAVLEFLNRNLCRTGGGRAFLTLFYAIFDPRTGEIEYGGAGHPFPYLRRASGEILELGRGALPLGIRSGQGYPEVDRVTIEPGDLLFLYSDGLPEAPGGADGDAFGFERLRRLLELPGDAQLVHDRVLADVDRHLGEAALADDLTVVVLYRHPPVELPPLPRV